MARQKGMLNLSGNLEPLAGAPLDSRTITPTVADLYIASNWPYKYIGMKTTVTATGDTYRLVNLDVTQESSWVLDGGSGGQTIQVESMPLATESDLGKVLQYIGATDLNYTNGYFYKCVYKNSSYLWEQQNVQPDSEGQTIQVETMPTASAEELGKIYQYIGQDGGGALHGYFYECVALQGGGYAWLETEVSAPTEELSSSDMEDVKGAFSPVIESVGGLPILFDEGGIERQVGWYRYANGTKKPVYEKEIDIEITQDLESNLVYANIGASVDKVISLASLMVDASAASFSILNIFSDNEETNMHKITVTAYTNRDSSNANKLRILDTLRLSHIGRHFLTTIRYTKTTDTPA